MRPVIVGIPALLTLAVAGLFESAKAQAPTAYWPQYRGPERSNISREAGLLKEWPKDGPPLLWKVTNVGNGIAPVSVAEGRLYTVAYRDGQEFAVALDRGTGKEVWATAIGKARQDGIMQFLLQRQPVIDGERIYVFSGNAELFCLERDGGQVLWSKNYLTEFQAQSIGFGWTDNPLVDGERLICTPGGKEAAVVALDKRTGAVIWRAVLPEGDRATHSPLVVAEVGGIRQYVQLFNRGLVGIAAKDGKFLWRYDKLKTGTASAAAPVVRGDLVFATCGYGVGSALVKLIPGKDGIAVEEVYYTRSFMNLHGGLVLVGDHLYGGNGSGYGFSTPCCVELPTGKLIWQQRPGPANAAFCVLAAEGRLYCRYGNGLMVLIEASPEGYREKGQFMQPDRSTLPAYTQPVLAGGRLYLRNQGVLLCYDVRANPPVVPKAPAPDKRERRDLPDAIFVPSPQDVVDKMLELAGVKKSDVVVDLGCGDGRVVVTAAKKYGCQAIGYDIDEELVARSRDNVKKNEVDKLVRIEHQDIFKVDLSNVDVVALYLLPPLNTRLIPQLEKMKPGSRIISHAFDMPGAKPDKVVPFVSRDDGIERKLYLWTTPLNKARSD